MSGGIEEAKAEAKARRIQKEERRKEKERGRVRDVIPKDDDAAAARALEKERLLKGVARSGVARLYNAIRAAQVKADEAAKVAKKEGVVGLKNREEKGESYFPVADPRGRSGSRKTSDANKCARNSYGNVKAGLLGVDTVDGETKIENFFFFQYNRMEWHD